MKKFTNARIFTGTEWIENGTVICDGGRITGIDNSSGIHDDAVDCGGQLLVPALLDLQIYGAGDKLFSAYPEPASLAILAEENKKAGVAECLATIATQPLDVIYKSIAAIKSYWQQGGRGIMGMHLEGPFINPVKRGAHKASWIHEPSEAEVMELLEAGSDVIKIVTLAPECCSPSIINMFADAGVIVSAGHCNAGYQEANNFDSRGIKLVTHLFNAMSPLHHRDTGLPGAAMENKSLMASIIPDGIHVSYSALRIAKKQMGDRLYFITDSVTTTNIGEYQHQLNNDHYCTADGTLSGSAITLLQGVRNAVQFCEISLDESIRMASLYPARILGLQNDYGAIASGKKASMLLLNDKLELVQNFIDD
jgi:N-acetylglucosamine-6-phosphate deacetylase